MLNSNSAKDKLSEFDHNQTESVVTRANNIAKEIRTIHTEMIKHLPKIDTPTPPNEFDIPTGFSYGDELEINRFQAKQRIIKLQIWKHKASKVDIGLN